MTTFASAQAQPITVEMFADALKRLYDGGSLADTIYMPRHQYMRLRHYRAGQDALTRNRKRLAAMPKPEPLPQDDGPLLW